MAAYTRMEIGVGLFIMAGALALGYLSLSLGALELLPQPRIHLGARFASAGELKAGAPVKLAGVAVGKVTGIALKDYAAEVSLTVDTAVELPVDTIASITTTGLLGESYVSLSPGAAEKDLKDGDRITRTEPPIDLMELISKYVFGSGVQGDETPAPP